MPRAGRGYFALKRAFDLVACLLLLPVIVPVLLACALAVALDSPGPMFFTQERTGRHGRRFRMFKFRTMVCNAEELKATLQHLNILPPPDFKIIDDPRITRVGKFLRRTSLDELPQIFNVLRGDMSLVGPRPTSFAPSTYDLWHTQRLEVPPGITGLWQVKGRNDTTFDERLRLDIR
ncbi:MAG TPA: sugar transferase, partial [Thermoleophilaceae bacterium]|nr:sugar transferase [Thermoleophilaceae bacterium]